MKKSAEGGSIYGMEGLAEFYEKGYGLDAPDMNNAFNWYRQAAQKGSEKAKKYLKNRNLKW
jgi:TPR repeat protein